MVRRWWKPALVTVLVAFLGWDLLLNRPDTVQGFAYEFFYRLFFWVFIALSGFLLWKCAKAIAWRWRFALLVVTIATVTLSLSNVSVNFPTISVDVSGTDYRPKDLDDKIDDTVTWMVSHWRSFFREASGGMLKVLGPLERHMLEMPWWLFIGVVTLLGWRVSGYRIAIASAGGLTALAVFGMWDQSMRTLAVVGTAACISIMIAVPVGIVMSKNSRVEGIMKPILDTMQTMPAFVYLIPAIFFLGLGKVPAVMATMVYAMPPAMRLTDLGIRMVPAEPREAARAFGTTSWQMLMKVELPLARPTIMAGINQTIMMALAMVVVASLVGAQGLGADVLKGIQSLAFGSGLMAGVGIVVLAVIIDRISQGFARDPRQKT